MLKLQGVTKYFLRNTVNEVLALKEIDFSVQEGDFVTIIGSNGAGKSTLLHAIAGSVSVDEGRIELEGQDITRAPEHERARFIGRIAQDPTASTCAAMSIEENLAMAAMRGRRRGLHIAVGAHNREMLRRVLTGVGLGLDKRMSTRVATLSGGQRQALGLLMATIARPKLLLLDEHLANLDPRTAAQVMEITHHIVATHRLTTLMVTHNMTEALRWGRRLIMMHEGRIILDFPEEEKRNLQVGDLVEKFHEVSKDEFAVDRMLLSV